MSEKWRAETSDHEGDWRASSLISGNAPENLLLCFQVSVLWFSVVWMKSTVKTLPKGNISNISVYSCNCLKILDWLRIMRLRRLLWKAWLTLW